jgi:hypothetical protein
MEAGHCYPPVETSEANEEAWQGSVYGTLSGCSVVGVPPVAEYSHATGCSVTGVGVYRGDEFASLDGTYFAADYCSGIVFGLKRDDAGAWQFEELLHTGILATGSGVGEDGRLYITSFNADFPQDANPAEEPRGSLYVIVAADQVPEGAELAPTPAPEEDDATEPTPTVAPEASPTV